MAKEEQKMQVFSRLMEFPVLSSAFEWIKRKYEDAKKSEVSEEFFLRTEAIVIKSADKLKPSLEKLESQILTFDNYAVKGLKKIEETFPITKKQPEELKAALTAYLQDLKSSGKMDVFWSRVRMTAKEVLNIVLEFIKSMLKAETVVLVASAIANFLLPPLKDEPEFSKTTTLDLKVVFSNCIHRMRYYGKALVSMNPDVKWSDFPLLAFPAKLWSVPLLVYYEMMASFSLNKNVIL
ncbi:perilipin-3-like [Centruroides sculpturatus]|uniref:perilipin-3-like n=1 Tax=Centruroides sculpturatus TaxID=218467 RepID=UPI000C6D0013|nr:perilipin-3-like [Centruroides sculpturatus]